MFERAQVRILPVVNRAAEQGPLVGVCCNACRTCTTTNLVALLAAFVAGALDAARLILIKPATELSDPVDPYFATTLPAGMPHSILGCDRMDELATRLSD